MSVRLPFKVEVETIGEFTFRQASIRDEVRIEADRLEMIGNCGNDELGAVAAIIAELDRLTEVAPVGWDLNAMSLHDADTIVKILLVSGRLKEERVRFRQKSETKGIPGGEGSKQDSRVPVSAAVQPPTD